MSKRKVDRAIREHYANQPTVAIGYLYGVDVAAGFANSLAAMLWVQGSRPDRKVVTEVLAEHSGVNVAGGRNKVVQRFLATSCDWLLMLDADMTFEPDLPDALLAMASADADSERFAPIVGGLCFGVSDGALFPTMYDFQPTPDGKLTTVRYETFPRDSMFAVGATGAACLLVHRSVFEAVAAKAFNPVYPWFQETELNGERCGEDITFCLRAQIAGFPIFVNTAVPVGHQKSYVLTLDMYRQQRAQAGRSADVGRPDPQG